MSERPILFSGPMVRAILAGTKTQTRRVVKPQPAFTSCQQPLTPGLLAVAEAGMRVLLGGRTCPYGVPGDRLWVRETWQFDMLGASHSNGQTSADYRLGYRADDFQRAFEYEGPTEADPYVKTFDSQRGEWRPSIFMPRWASRITLEVTEVRVQRLQEISEDDAKAEGIPPLSLTAEEIARMAPGPHKELAKALGPGAFTSRFEFEMLWQSINAKRGYGWDSNPWVWALTFRRLP